MKFVFTCGGTAGHINPALAVAGRLRELLPDAQFLFIGVEGKMEMRLVPLEGYEIRGLNMTYIQRGHDLKALRHNLETLKNVAHSTREAREILRDFGPDAVIGTGGYICYPVLKAAEQLHIPCFVHESNAVPGLTTKLLADHVDGVLLGLEESRQYYHHPERVVVTGTPVRGEFDRHTQESAKAAIGLAPDEKLVVSVWGSLGASHMNKTMAELIPMLDGQQGFRLIHAAGSLYYEELKARLEREAPDLESRGVELREYIYDMPRVMAAADLILCRAGASTISELSYLGKPVVMVPSPNVTNNHQEKNARVLESAGGAEVMLEGEFDAPFLLERIQSLLRDEERLEAMSRAMHALSSEDAAGRIAEIILERCTK
ncbi:MAG: UDP-N-acetylglucosamine--N-acetylmuramyl-(pentapeptide) pyrophosphoryl-undecaprenol N-acetylglucosamine transferase [Oscillospiraceae bacterium]|nr:UDP-N-acetylglucosamine--N-acetylmuramyl-(pentapeptide) pyrophosphoryl-undecaprenol N-acetylglucosamine transferase [Oscillospiraceae bacterium]